MQFYDEALKYQKRVSNQYQGYMKKEEEYKRSRNRDTIFDFKKNLEMMEHHSQQSDKLKEEKQVNLRKVLHEQIQKRSEGKESRDSSRKKKRYT